jgi:hypothetical protein
MQGLVRVGRQELSSRSLRQALELHKARSARCLLLDVSGSMVSLMPTGTRKIDRLRELAKDFPHERIFVFADGCRETTAVPEPHGGTDLAGAFRHVREHGVCHVVLITDGLPDNEQAALREAAGLKVDVLYAGPLPQPDFLSRLALATGGHGQVVDLGDRALLGGSVRGLLGDGR